ncbi:MAG: hypothetical protein AAFO69_09900, partial [Bacteroidota bacterium]
CTIKNYQEKIIVQNKMRINVVDYAKYLSSEIDNNKTWVRVQLEEVCQSVLFDKSYLDIIFDTENQPGEQRIEYEIKNQMELRATEVGLAIDQHFILPALAPLQLKDGFVIDNSQQYATNNAEIRIKIQMVLNGRIENLRSVEKLIERQIDIKAEIERIAKRTIEREMHKISAEKALLFNLFHPDDPEQLTCEEILKKHIIKDLAAFGIDPLDLTLKAGDSELKERLQILMRGTRVLELSVEPKQADENIEVVNFDIEYKIEGVEPSLWHVFHNDRTVNAEGEIDVSEQIVSLEKTISNDLKAKFQQLPIEYLRFTDYNTHLDIQRKLVEPACDKVKNVYGLRIRFVNMVRQSTAWERSHLLVNEKEAELYQTTRLEAHTSSVESKKKELAILQEKRLILIEDNDDGENDKEIRRLEKKIEEIEGSQKSFSTKKTIKEKKQLDADKKSFSLDVFDETPKKLTSENNDEQKN